MKKLQFLKDFKRYVLKGDHQQYYKPRMLVRLLELELGKKFPLLKQQVENSRIYVTEAEIKDHLDRRFEIENAEMKRRFEKYLSGEREEKETAQAMVEFVEHLSDNIEVKRYRFDPYTLHYYQRCVETFKNKTLQLFNLVERLDLNEGHLVQDLIDDLGVDLNEDGYINKKDVERLIKPAVYNYQELMIKLDDGNDLDTYLTMKISPKEMAVRGLTEAQIFPCRKLQIKHPFNDKIDTNVPLSKQQKIAMKEQRKHQGLHLVTDITKEF